MSEMSGHGGGVEEIGNSSSRLTPLQKKIKGKRVHELIPYITLLQK